MRRTASLASPDTAQSKHNRYTYSKTPPLSRKYNDTGKKSFQDKMLRIIPRRSNSSKSRATAEAATQTAPAAHLTPGFLANKSFLYPKASVSPAPCAVNNGKTAKPRLGSCGEELDENNTQNNNRAEQSRVDAKARGAFASQNCGGCAAARRDSGLSGCYAPASCESSVPATPDFHARLGGQVATAFKFPASFAYDEIAVTNTAATSEVSVVLSCARTRKTRSLD